MSETLLSLKNVNKYFGKLHVLKNISLDIYKGEFLTLLGPSGCGKTTILRSIAGFERIDSGDITLHGESIVGQPANKRNVNTVFQNYALFPHLTVYENIAYGPKIQKSMTKEEIEERVHEVLQLVQMEEYEERKPDQMSGGQRQRIAIARALINRPDILLLDEPLGALDLKLRKHMQYELSNIQKKTETTFVYVTHDQEEALNMSDRLVVMNEGKFEQIGTPAEVYNHPANLFVASFVGERNILPVKVLEQVDARTVAINIGGTSVNVRCSLRPCENIKPGLEVMLAVHSDKMKVVCEKAENAFPAIVKSVHYSGSQIRTQVEVDGHTLRIIEYFSKDCDYKAGDTAYITWQENGAVLLPMEGKRIEEAKDEAV